MWKNNDKSGDKRKVLLKRILKNKKFYSDQAFEILKGDILDDLELENEEQNAKFAEYVDYLINHKKMDLLIIKNSILSGVNSEYLIKWNVNQ